MSEFKHIKTFKEDENFISMAQYSGTIVVCTDRGIYILEDDKLKPVEIINKESNDQETHS